MVLMGRARHQDKEFYLAVGVPVRGMFEILQASSAILSRIAAVL